MEDVNAITSKALHAVHEIKEEPRARHMINITLVGEGETPNMEQLLEILKYFNSVPGLKMRGFSTDRYW